MSAKIIAAVLSAGAAVLLAAPASARPCAQADLEGVWRLTSVTAVQPEVRAFYADNPVEYVRFSGEGAYAVVNGREPLSGLEAIDASLSASQAAAGGALMGIVMNDPGELILMNRGEAFEGYMCAVEGDTLVWTETEGSPAVRKVLARVR